jgi:rubrerythrin
MVATAQPVGSLAECYAQALAIEREAAARCSEFAEFLEEHGELSTAAVFRKLARYEKQHANELERRAAGFPLPRLQEWQYSWLDAAPPQQVSHELVFHLMTPYDALKIALGAEERARVLFERVARETEEPKVRELALELASTESEHVGWLQEALEKCARPPVTEADFESMLTVERRGAERRHL